MLSRLIASVLAALLLTTAHSNANPDKDAFCFSARATVSVYGKGSVPMSELKVGDFVVTGMFVAMNNSVHFNKDYRL